MFFSAVSGTTPVHVSMELKSVIDPRSGLLIKWNLDDVKKGEINMFFLVLYCFGKAAGKSVCFLVSKINKSEIIPIRVDPLFSPFSSRSLRQRFFSPVKIRSPALLLLQTRRILDSLSTTT